jgi:hypothetical protein
MRVGDHAEHGFLLEGRHGADDENSGSAVAGDGTEDHVVSSGRDFGLYGSACAARSGYIARSTSI